MPLTDEEKEGLEPEEILALEADLGDPDENAPEGDDPPADPPADTDPEKKADPPADGDKDPVDPPAEDPPADPPAKADPPADAEPEPATAPAPVPGVTMPIIPAEEIQALKSAVEEAQAKFDDGEIPHDELLAAQRALDKAEVKNEMAEDYNKAAASAGWEYEQKRFWQNNPTWREAPALEVAMTGTVNKMLADGEGGDLTDEQFLQEAQKRVIADFEKAGFKVTAGDHQATTPEADKKKLLADAKKKGADRSKVPLDLKDVPAADDAAGGDEFAYLDNLDGEKYEKAISNMTPAQLERYENAH